MLFLGTVLISKKLPPKLRTVYYICERRIHDPDFPDAETPTILFSRARILRRVFIASICQVMAIFDVFEFFLHPAMLSSMVSGSSKLQCTSIGDTGSCSLIAGFPTGEACNIAKVRDVV